jgi:hypothetical protein
LGFGECDTIGRVSLAAFRLACCLTAMPSGPCGVLRITWFRSGGPFARHAGAAFSPGQRGLTMTDAVVAGTNSPDFGATTASTFGSPVFLPRFRADDG